MNAIRDAVLLVLAPLADLVVSVRRLFRVVFVVVNLAADLILLAVDLGLLIVGEIAATGLSVGTNLFVDVGFLLFQILSLSRSTGRTSRHWRSDPAGSLSAD